MGARIEARAIMEAVGALHQEGYGHLKLYCYVKTGLPSWRFLIFASPHLLETIEKARGSVPHHFGSTGYDGLGETAVEATATLKTYHGDLLEHAKGEDLEYTGWYQQMLRDSAPHGYLEMEQPGYAEVSGKPYPVAEAWKKYPIFQRY